MAYATTNPPRLIAGGLTGLAGGGQQVWIYTSADAKATVDTAGYITDGYFRGMRVGDTVIVRDTATPTTTIMSVVSSNSSTGAVDLSDGLAVTLTNTD